MRLEVGDMVYIHNSPNEWGSGTVVGILEHGALISIETTEHKGIYYFYFDELEKVT